MATQQLTLGDQIKEITARMNDLDPSLPMEEKLDFDLIHSYPGVLSASSDHTYAKGIEVSWNKVVGMEKAVTRVPTAIMDSNILVQWSADMDQLNVSDENQSPNLALLLSYSPNESPESVADNIRPVWSCILVFVDHQQIRSSFSEGVSYLEAKYKACTDLESFSYMALIRIPDDLRSMPFLPTAEEAYFVQPHGTSSWAKGRGKTTNFNAAFLHRVTFSADEPDRVVLRPKHVRSAVSLLSPNEPQFLDMTPLARLWVNEVYVQEDDCMSPLYSFIVVSLPVVTDVDSNNPPDEGSALGEGNNHNPSYSPTDSVLGELQVSEVSVSPNVETERHNPRSEGAMNSSVGSESEGTSHSGDDISTGMGQSHHVIGSNEESYNDRGLHSDASMHSGLASDSAGSEDEDCVPANSVVVVATVHSEASPDTGNRGNGNPPRVPVPNVLASNTEEVIGRAVPNDPPLIVPAVAPVIPARLLPDKDKLNKILQEQREVAKELHTALRQANDSILGKMEEVYRDTAGVSANLLSTMSRHARAWQKELSELSGALQHSSSLEPHQYLELIEGIEKVSQKLVADSKEAESEYAARKDGFNEIINKAVETLRENLDSEADRQGLEYSRKAVDAILPHATTYSVAPFMAQIFSQEMAFRSSLVSMSQNWACFPISMLVNQMHEIASTSAQVVQLLPVFTDTIAQHLRVQCTIKPLYQILKAGNDANCATLPTEPSTSVVSGVGPKSGPKSTSSIAASDSGVSSIRSPDGNPSLTIDGSTSGTGADIGVTSSAARTHNAVRSSTGSSSSAKDIRRPHTPKQKGSSLPAHIAERAHRSAPPHQTRALKEASAAKPINSNLVRPRSTPGTPSTPSSLGSRLPDIKTKQASIPTPPADTRSGAGSFKVVKVPNPDHKAGTTHRRSSTSGATSTAARSEKGRSPRRANAHAPPKTSDTSTGKGHGSPLPDRDPPKMVSVGSTGKPVGARTGCNTKITPKRFVEFSNPRTGKTMVIANTPEEVKRAESMTGLRLIVNEMAKSKPSGSSKAEGGHSLGLTVQDGGTAGGSGSDSSRKRKSKKKKRSEHNLMRPATNPIQIDTDSDDPECRPPPQRRRGKRYERVLRRPLRPRMTSSAGLPNPRV